MYKEFIVKERKAVCDSCNTQIPPYRIPEQYTCLHCGTHVCGECGHILPDRHDPSNEMAPHIRRVLCSACHTLYKEPIEEFYNLVTEIKSLMESVDEKKHILNQKREKLHLLIIPTPPEPEEPDTDDYKTKRAVFESYQKKVEKGNYKSHKEMIRLYTKLLQSVPENTKLANQIEDKIEAHEVDEAQEILGH